MRRVKISYHGRLQNITGVSWNDWINNVEIRPRVLIKGDKPAN